MVPIAQKEDETSSSSEEEDLAITNMTLDSIELPENVLNGSNSQEWKEAIVKEYEALLRNKTWQVCNRPSGCKTIDSKFVLKIKLNQDGSIERRKARLVARGFSQRPGIDYEETFSPVIRLGTIRTMIAIAVEPRHAGSSTRHRFCISKWRS